eukprot:3444382-Amphidinium_carterae.1
MKGHWIVLAIVALVVCIGITTPNPVFRAFGSIGRQSLFALGDTADVPIELRAGEVCGRSIFRENCVCSHTIGDFVALEASGMMGPDS